MKKMLFLLVLIVNYSYAEVKITKMNTPNEFAFNLFTSLHKKNQDQNLFFSPASIRWAFALTYAGARGETREQLLKAFGYIPDEKMQAEKDYITFGLMKPSKLAQFNIANSIWFQKNLTLEKSYSEMMKMKYGSNLESLDFSNKAESAKKINLWVTENTGGKIKNLIKESDLSSELMLALVNAVYFKSKWFDPFLTTHTTEAIFKNGTKSISTKFMNQTSDLLYSEDKDTQVLSMKYEDDRYSMITILPKTYDGLSQIIPKLDIDYISKHLSTLKEVKVKLKYPKFHAESSFDLTGALKKLGISNALDSNMADFSGISSTTKLFIGMIIHKALIDVDEAGTEAAAATMIAMPRGIAMPKSDKPIEFNADHPFVYFIYDHKTDTILFLGKMMNPKQ